eukprot:10454252-Lingulodinium_polyedra.AAC.1
MATVCGPPYHESGLLSSPKSTRRHETSTALRAPIRARAALAERSIPATTVGSSGCPSSRRDWQT